MIEAAKANREGVDGNGEDDLDEYNREDQDETGDRIEDSKIEDTTKDGTRATEARMTE